MHHTDVIIIGAGPAGTTAAALLQQAGKSVVCAEKSVFPRFSIGESLLPHCMEFLEQAGLAEVLHEQASALNFQPKNGARFSLGGKQKDFDFRQKSSAGPGTTYQVKRADFDKMLADAVAARGVDIRYGQSVTALDYTDEQAVLSITPDEGEPYQIGASFVLDASGFGRVLPRLLDLETPSDFPVRQAVFCHINDGIDDVNFDREKILITVHPQHPDVWFWLIPFSDGTASLGVVGAPERFDNSMKPGAILWQQVRQTRDLSALLHQAEVRGDVRQLTGYAADVKQLSGPRYALLGNAGEFLDPVFSSGVTIAMRSAATAVPLVVRELAGDAPNWHAEYDVPLRRGIDTFRVFVEAWYEGGFQDIVFSDNPPQSIKNHICAILAGYAWDESNPYVKEPARRVDVLSELCRAS